MWTDHRGLHIDISYNTLLDNKTIDLPSLFNRKLQSKYPASVWFYKRYLEEKITKQKLESKLELLLKNAQQPKLTKDEEDELNIVDNKTTFILIGMEKDKQSRIYSLVSRATNRNTKSNSWEIILTQARTNILQQK